MQTRLKLLFYYVSELILAILITCLSLLVIAKVTFLNSNYVLDQFKKNNYYAKLSESIKSEMGLYTDQSGLDEVVLEDLYTESTLELETKNFIKNIYDGKTTIISTDELKINIEDNIDKYLKDNNLKVDNQEELDLFIDEMLNIYTSKLTMSNLLNPVAKRIIKINKLVMIAIIFLSIAILLLLVLNKIISRRNVMTIPFITTSMIIFLGNYLLFDNIDAEHILIWNENISNMISKFIQSISSYTLILATILIVISILNTIVFRLIHKNKKR